MKKATQTCLRILLLLSTGLLNLSVLAVSTPRTSLSIEQATQRTLSHSPYLYQFEFVTQHLAANREVSALRPDYNLGFEVENFAGSGNKQNFEQAEVTIALSSVIELGDKRKSRVSVADARQNKFSLTRQAETLDVLGNLTAAFIRSLTTQEEIRLAEEAVALAEALLSAVSERTKRGAASDADVIRARAMVTQSHIRRHNLQQKFERQKVSLAKFWGESHVDFTELNGDLFLFGESQSFASLFEKVENSPAVDVLASDSRLKEAEVRLARTQNRADINWQVGVRHFEETDDTALTLGFSVPLFSGIRNRSAVNAAMAERNAVDYQRTDTLLTLHENLFNAFSQRQQYIDNCQQLKELIIPDLEKALRLIRDAYDRGRLRYQDWIVAQQELLSAKQQLIDSASAALLNQAVIEQLTAESLAQ